MNRKLLIFIISLLTIWSYGVQAQQVISSAGASATGTNVQLSWNIGEPVIETFTSATAILTQGLLQTKLVVTDINPVVHPEMSMMVYPNPVSVSLKLDIQGEVPKDLYIRLFDLNGKQILIRKLEALPELINMENFSRGIYILKVLGTDDEPLKTFKVIRN